MNKAIEPTTRTGSSFSGPLSTIWQGQTPLVCIARTEETPDCASFELAAPTGQIFDFFPGQFISVGAEIEGQTHWRAYSISSSPSRPETLSITVKRVPGGRVSNWLLDHGRAGMRLPALAPAGEFGLQTLDLPATLALFSAGSGVTPMVSMARWLLETGADVQIHFFHSARSEADVIFGRELLALDQDHAHFHLHLFLSQPQGSLPCHRGRLDAQRLQALLPLRPGTALSPAGSAVQAWLCGQDGYMDSVSGWLQSAGLDAQHIHRESFTPRVAGGAAADAPRFELQVPAFDRTLEAAAGETLLEVLEREGLPIIAACRTGICGSCKCKLLSGQVQTSSSTPLTPEEVAAGMVLACSSSVTGDLALALG